jgi:hypothetical protein
MTAERWVLKTPMHLGHVDKIVDIFPDATFAQTHRDPVATIPSYASMIYELWRGVGETSDPVEAGRETSGTLEHDLNRCLAVRDTLPSGKFIDIDFRDTVKDPVSVVERIYRHIGLPMTDTARRQIGEYMSRTRARAVRNTSTRWSSSGSRAQTSSAALPSTAGGISSPRRDSRPRAARRYTSPAS